MSKFKEFIIKYDRKIVMAFITVVPILIALLGFMPSLIENYTFNAFLNGERDNYLDFYESFKFMQILSFGYVIIGILYNIIRRMADKNIVKDAATYINCLHLIVSMVISIILSISLVVISNTYENKNIEFVQSKLIDIKAYIQDGKCYAARAYNEADFNIADFGQIANCSTISQKLPGKLFFNHSGVYNSSTVKDGVVLNSTEAKPNEIIYRGFFGPFCRSLVNKDNALYTVFDEIQVAGINPLSDKFSKSDCHTYKNSQITFTFK